ncbi:hypothetical protein [Streptomyces montanus]|nr:hypothetical protein [Streptomyces montanus]
MSAGQINAVLDETCTKVLREYADRGLLRLARGPHHHPGPGALKDQDQAG